MALTAIMGTAAGLLYLGVAMAIASRKFSGNPLDSRFPSPAESTAG